ncbi:Two-component sensor histidine kinase, contains HisKA and HATPase domains [Filimonas lacunae]|uniref:histidine kinase n=2 Tax=Filimonas lacunae TaxID=477680 RepID=A0A1N7NHM2_9BACT|nr:Two-component sensor histidine kinase, contains HisKA and HATPase domains [Filimonas lacunae]
MILLLGISCFFTSNAQMSGLASGTPALLQQIPRLSTDTARITALLKAADYYLFKADIIGQDDSAQHYLEQARLLNFAHHIPYAENHIQLLKTFINGNSGTLSPTTYQAHIARFQQTGDKANERLAWQLLGESIRNQQMDSLELSAYTHARLLAQQQGDKEQELHSRASIAQMYLDAHKGDTAQILLQKIITEATPYPGPLTNAYDHLATYFLNSGKIDSALFYSLRSEHIKVSTGDTTYITNSYNLLCRIYYVLKEHEQAIIWNRKALNHCLWTKKYGIVMPILSSIVADMLELKKAPAALRMMDSIVPHIPITTAEDKRLYHKTYGKIYFTLGNYKQAETQYYQAIHYGIAEGLKYSTDAKGSDYRALGIIYYHTGQYARSHLYLDSALQTWQPSGRQDFLLQIHKDLCQTDSALGDFRSAMLHLRSANEISLILYDKDRDKTIEQLNFQYKTEEREKDVQLLQKEQLLDHQQLSSARTIRNWIIAASLLLMLLAILLYRQSRHRRNTNAVITQKNALLEKLLEEKKWLLKEVHHRVKNNLHTIVSLLESQAAFLDKEALQAVEKSQHRVYAMSLVHQKLYRQDELRTIDMSVYMREFVQYLAESFGNPSHIHFSTHTENIALDVTRAIAVGMITNEAVTNAMKYAFPDHTRGEINVTLVQKAQTIILTIADNGIGMMLQGSNAEINSLGMELMKGFARDLDGSIQFDNRLGTVITLSFQAEDAAIAAPLPKMDIDKM